MKNLKLNTIYPAFMGEVNKYGIGAPCTFVRLAGCNLRCYEKTKGTLCDTPEALTLSCGKDVSVDYIVSSVKEIGKKLVCLTGGEPLMQDVTELLEALVKAGCYVVVETNGTKSIAKYQHIKNVSFVVDYKCCSTGENSKMDETNYSLMGPDDYLKFVVDDYKDLNQLQEFIGAYPYFKGCIAVGLFWGAELKYMNLIQFVQESKLPIYLNMQTHKMACLYDECKKESKLNIFVPREL